MINLGLIGWGNIAKYYYNAINKLELKLVSVLDNNEGKRRDVLKTGAEFFREEDWNEFLGSVDAVIIATPHYLHAKQTIDSLKSGKHVLCEKPMAINIEDAVRMIDTAVLSNRILMVASHLRYRPAMQRLIMHPDIIGKINRVEVNFLEDVSNYTPGESWLYNRFKSGGGCVIDSGINAFDCLRQVLGELKVERVKFEYKDKEGKKELDVETTAEIDFIFGSNYKGKLNISWIAKKEVREAIFYGTIEEYKIDWISPDLVGAQTDMTQEYIDLMKDFMKKLEQRDYVEKHGLEALKLVIRSYELAK